MERWVGKVAIVTGASSGIGEAIAEALVKRGVKVVGLARRMERLQALASKLGKDNFFSVQCDLRKEGDLLRAFKWVEKELGGADILVNNAGAGGLRAVIDSSTEEYYRIIETNLIAPAICAREAIQSMRKRNAGGHVVNINSITGRFAETIHIPIGMYAASKYGLTALGTELRHEIIAANLNVKITNVNPGLVHTDMVSSFMPPGKKMSILQVQDVAEAVVYVLGTPEHVEIPELLIIPHGKPIGGNVNLLVSTQDP